MLSGGGDVACADRKRMGEGFRGSVGCLSGGALSGGQPSARLGNGNGDHAAALQRRTPSLSTAEDPPAAAKDPLATTDEDWGDVDEQADAMQEARRHGKGIVGLCLSAVPVPRARPAPPTPNLLRWLWSQGLRVLGASGCSKTGRWGTG